MKRSKFSSGTFLLDSEGNAFLHDGNISADGYGCVLGFYEGNVMTSSGFSNWCKDNIRGVASSYEIDILIKSIHVTERIEKY